MARCDSYDPGECTRGACEATTWVRDGWGNAKDWWAPASRDGFQLSLVPTVGAVVLFGPGHGYDARFGHLAVVTKVYNPKKFQVLEMNYVAWNKYDVRDVAYFDIEDFILPPGVAPGSPGGGGGPTLPPGANGPDDLGFAWGQFARFWNTDIERDVTALVDVGNKITAIQNW